MDDQTTQRPIAITTGEPAGIGPELIARLLQMPRTAPLIVVGDAKLLLERASMVGLQLFLTGEWLVGPGAKARLNHISLKVPSIPGQLDPRNVDYVMEVLRQTTDGCLSGEFSAMVTGPVQKSIIREAGYNFIGHTEFLAERSGAKTPVMMLVKDGLRVALVTIHLPLAEVPSALTAELLERVLRVIDHDLKTQFNVDCPVMGVCGLNPHAGESGHLGSEEAEIIAPVLVKLKKDGFFVKGPLPADTAFTKPAVLDLDVVVAMYHDQGLPVVKHDGFGQAVNVTLGLPFVRTSVDHGTALDIASSGRASADSLITALNLAETLVRG